MSDLPVVPSPDRAVSAMGERVARVETKIEGVERDTGVIRATLHDINNEMQKFVLQEARCVAALETIVAQTRHLPDIASRMQSFEEMRPQLTGVINEEMRRRGAWRGIALLATTVMGAVTMLGTIAAGAVWMLARLH